MLKIIENDFFCGTEQGDVLFTSSKLVKDGDSGKLVAPRPNWQSDAHAGPITTVARSPFFPDVVLTVGGWSFSIWKETENADVSSTPLLHVRFVSRESRVLPVFMLQFQLK